MIFFLFLFWLNTVPLFFSSKRLIFFVYMWYHFFRLSFWSVLTFFFNSRWGWGRLLPSRYNLTIFFDSTGIKKCGFFLGIQKFHHLFSSRSLRYFGLLSCNWALRHIESIENQNVVIVFGQSNNVALRGNLQATAPRYFHLK